MSHQTERPVIVIGGCAIGRWQMCTPLKDPGLQRPHFVGQTGVSNKRTLSFFRTYFFQCILSLTQTCSFFEQRSNPIHQSLLPNLRLSITT